MIRTYKKYIVSLCIVASLAGCTSRPLPALEWSCRNNDAEISCHEGNCVVTAPSEFTPMELTFSTDGKLSLCAYSGCWSGKTDKMLTAGNYFSVIGLALPWSGTAVSPADISVTINMKTNTATIQTSDYAQPMTCEVL